MIIKLIMLHVQLERNMCSNVDMKMMWNRDAHDNLLTIDVAFSNIGELMFQIVILILTKRQKINVRDLMSVDL